MTYDDNDQFAPVKAFGKKLVIYLPVVVAIFFGYRGLTDLGFGPGDAFLITCVHASLAFTLTWIVPRFLTARLYEYKNMPWIIALIGVCIAGFDAALVHNGLKAATEFTGEIEGTVVLSVMLWLGSFAGSAYNTFADWVLTYTLEDKRPVPEPVIVPEPKPVNFTFTDLAVNYSGGPRKEISESELEAALLAATAHLRKSA